MAAPDALRRLGGGRWETKDGRFQIEPQSGTWVIVDTTQTNEFGLPLVRGPFGSLGAAREAIESARSEGPAESPLAGRIGTPESTAPSKPTKSTPATSGESKEAPRTEPSKPATKAKPPEPREPRWLRALGTTDRRTAKRLIERLDELGIAGAEELARAEVTGGEPAMAQLALERGLQDVIRSTKSSRAAVRAVIDLLLVGQEDELGARWRLVDDRGRRIEKLDLD